MPIPIAIETIETVNPHQLQQGFHGFYTLEPFFNSILFAHGFNNIIMHVLVGLAAKPESTVHKDLQREELARKDYLLIS